MNSVQFVLDPNNNTNATRRQIRSAAISAQISVIEEQEKENVT